MKRETVDLALGLAVLVLGIALLLFTFANALALAANPGAFIADQLPAQQTQGPSAAFTWSSDGFNLSVQDTSQPGAVSITAWQWDFGDNTGSVSIRNPGVHVYSNAGPYTVLLTVTDSDNRQSTTFSPVDIVPAQARSGQSIGDITSNLSNFSVVDLLLPVGVGVLTVGLYTVMALAGGMITKAGWNLIRPRPETIRIRLKPQHLQQMMEADVPPLPAQAQSTAPAQAPPPPPPQG